MTRPQLSASRLLFHGVCRVSEVLQKLLGNQRQMQQLYVGSSIAFEDVCWVYLVKSLGVNTEVNFRFMTQSVIGGRDLSITKVETD